MGDFLDELFSDLPNPFTDDYLKDEIAFYGPGSYSRDGIELKMLELGKGNARLDDYLNKNIRFTGPNVPVLTIDGRLWMSLTWMEVQSIFCPIQQAYGEVATAGLGLGYFALRAAAREDVEKVDVYEINRKVIDFFEAYHKDRPELSKINTIHGDARKELKNKTYDHAFIDIYPTLMSDSMIDDIPLFIERNDIDTYGFWTMEKSLLGALFMRHLEDDDDHPAAPEIREQDWSIQYQMVEKWFFKRWIDTEESHLWDGWYIKANWNYIHRLITTMKEHCLHR